MGKNSVIIAKDRKTTLTNTIYNLRVSKSTYSFTIIILTLPKPTNFPVNHLKMFVIFLISFYEVFLHVSSFVCINDR